MDETINIKSNLGERLDKIKKVEKGLLLFNGKEIPVVMKITIGRDSGNSIVIDDRMVSRFHAEVQKIEDSYYIRDMGSSNGTFVNGNRVPDGKYIKLGKDDAIRLGKSELSIK